MDSADAPLAIHGLYGGRHRQHHRHSTEEVHRRGGPIGGGPARLAIFHRSVLVRAAVCRQVAQQATHRLNGRWAPHSPTRPSSAFGFLPGPKQVTTSIRTVWNNQSPWNSRSIPEECLVPTQPHSGRHSCSLFSG